MGITPPQYAENSLDKKDMKMIDITETLDYSRDGLTNEAEEILSKRLEYASDESRLIDVYNGAMWTSFGNTFYYRYQFNFGTYFLLAIASIFVFVGLGCKNIKIVYELFVGRILATLFSGDLTGKRKMVRILEAIRDGYYALCFTAITLRSFFLFSDYITGRNFGGLERGIMILILAFVVVDGANLMQQITGIDAGMSSMAGKMIAGMHMARGAMSSIRNVRQMSQMKRQTKSLEEMKNSNNSEKNLHLKINRHNILMIKHRRWISRQQKIQNKTVKVTLNEHPNLQKTGMTIIRNIIKVWMKARQQNMMRKMNGVQKQWTDRLQGI